MLTAIPAPVTKYVIHKIFSIIVAGGISPVVLMEAQIKMLLESVWLKPTLDPTNLFQVKLLLYMFIGLLNVMLRVT
jgi:hypothetical protein